MALAAVMAALVFGSSLAHVIDDPVVAGWNWDVAVGNPHSGDTSAQTGPRLRKNPDVAGFTATAMGDGRLDGRDVPVVGMQPVSGDVAPARARRPAPARARRDRAGRPGTAGAAQAHRRPHHGTRCPRASRASYRRAGRPVARDHQRAGPARQRRGDDARRRERAEQGATGPQRVPRPAAQARRSGGHRAPEAAIPRGGATRGPAAGGAGPPGSERPAARSRAPAGAARHRHRRSHAHHLGAPPPARTRHPQGGRVRGKAGTGDRGLASDCHRRRPA